MENYNIETEFKYVIKSLPLIKMKSTHIKQIYFYSNGFEDILKSLFSLDTLEEISTFRAREITEENLKKHVITLKTKGKMTRKEYEKEVSEEIFFRLTNNNQKCSVTKVRYYKKVNNYTFEFDEYLSFDEALYTVEVEIDEEKQEERKKEIEEILNDTFKLEFKDVSLDERYKNSNLPFQNIKELKI